MKEAEQLTISCDVPWYQIAGHVNTELPTEMEGKKKKEKKKALVEYDLQQLAPLYEKECEKYNKLMVKGGDREWQKTILSSGTTSDKISALTLSIQSSPFHYLNNLEQLLGYAKKKSRREAIVAVEAIKDLMINNILPDRKLIFFKDRESKVMDVASGLLCFYEDALKKKYFEFVALLERLLQDPLPFVRTKLVVIVFELLCAKPEQEKNLLTLLVNKLGDGDNKIASKVSWLLSQVLVRHPNMVLIVANEVFEMMNRKNISKKAQYYGLVFINQIILVKSKPEVANRLLEIYFSFFSNMNEKDPLESKIMSSLLTGLNRALPFSSFDIEAIEPYLHHLFRIVHFGNFMTSIQSLMFLFQVSKSKSDLKQRYYKSLYELILDVKRIIDFSANKMPLFLNVIWKSLKEDDNLVRLKAFVKRILQVACSVGSSSFVCAVLLMISELIRMKPQLGHLIENIQKDKEGEEKTELYDPVKRDPLYANAEKSLAYELTLLAKNFHPSVKKYASDLLSGNLITCSTDPFLNFSLSNFLDKFIYKNPKKQGASVSSGSSIMQNVSNDNSRLAFMANQKLSTLRVPMNKKYSSAEAEAVPEDEEFFSKYFSINPMKIKEKADEDYEDFEAQVDRALQIEGNMKDEEVEFDSEEDDFEGEVDYDEDEGELDEGEEDELDEEDEVEDDVEDELDEEEDFEEDEDFDEDEGSLDGDDSDSKEDLKEEIEEIVESATKRKRKGSSNWSKRAKEMGIDTSSVFMDADSLSNYI